MAELIRLALDRYLREDLGPARAGADDPFEALIGSIEAPPDSSTEHDAQLYGNG